MAANTRAVRSRVFLSYAHEDNSAAREIARALEDRHLTVLLDQWQVEQDLSLTTSILHAIEVGDTFVLLLSSAALSGGLVQEDLGAALDRRDIDFVPVLLSDMDLPSHLSQRLPVEYSGGPATAQAVAERIALATAIDLVGLPPTRLEGLVLELLYRYGMALTAPLDSRDSGYDLRASDIGALGEAERTEILIQIKAYRSSRVSVSEIQRLSKLVQQRGSGVGGLLVTNGQLTSVARDALQRENEVGIWLRALEGPQLRRMLLENPDIARKYGEAVNPRETP